MMLDAIALEHRDRAVVAVDRAGDSDRALRHQEAVALVHGDFEMIGDDAELVHRHVEHRTGIDGHRSLPLIARPEPRTAGAAVIGRHAGDTHGTGRNPAHMPISSRKDVAVANNFSECIRDNRC